MNWRVLGWVAFFGVFPLTFAQAATLYLSPNTVELSRGDSVKLSLRLDVDRDECINAIDGVIHYTEDIEPVDISRGTSILSMWVEEPTINRDNRTITFAGGIPNGYCGRIVGDPRLTNNIVDIIFQSPGLVIGARTGTSTKALVSIADETQVYLNDGFGTRAPLTTFGATLHLANQAGSTVQNPWGDIVNNDNLPPEPFSITLERTNNAFSNRYFITFNTTDKQSGIDHYEVMEEPIEDFWSFRWGAVDAPWVTTRSPYVLTDQTLHSTIRVRAVDKAGNEYNASFLPEPSQRSLSWRSLIGLVSLITFGLLGLFSLIWFLLRTWRRRKVKLAATVISGADKSINDESVTKPSSDETALDNPN